ncbi:6-carboxytetrahydropterin synthase QueD [Selenomonas sp. oral taxon 478]|uniref:6-carboxytetrahydropterin synthase QueD n=1 Tax=Selenomonas sp. oral taxon 478 TaxID=712538 RepID=UPI00067A33F3|nr:6-carboxytetrahydropterin synthase QueD [Selenomonas sp. oral taxon 478]AKT54390.1 6-pyruvoyl tetrahydropterin synthase [Selenomonas sp. oral taxon 478]
MYTLRVEGAFEAAHRVVGYPGKCDRLHGHNWVVEAVFRGTELDDLGMMIDFKMAKAALMAVLDEFDHRYINEIPPFDAAANPTAENLARIIFERLAVRPEVTATAVHLAALTVWETPKSSVTYERD